MKKKKLFLQKFLMRFKQKYCKDKCLNFIQNFVGESQVYIFGRFEVILVSHVVTYFRWNTKIEYFVIDMTRRKNASFNCFTKRKINNLF